MTARVHIEIDHERDLAALPRHLRDALSTLVRDGRAHGLFVTCRTPVPPTAPVGASALAPEAPPTARQFHERYTRISPLARLAAEGDLDDPLTGHVMARISESPELANDGEG